MILPGKDGKDVVTFQKWNYISKMRNQVVASTVLKVGNSMLMGMVGSSRLVLKGIMSGGHGEHAGNWKVSE